MEKRKDLIKEVFEQKGVIAGFLALNREIRVTKKEFRNFKMEAFFGICDFGNVYDYELGFVSRLDYLRSIRSNLIHKKYREFMTTPTKSK